MPTPRFVVPVPDLLRTFRTLPSFAGNIAAIRELAEQPALTAPWPKALSPAVQSAAQAMGIEHPYIHQARAVEMALDPEGPRAIAVVTGTASGKSACYALPLAQAALDTGTQGTRALMLFPTKALAQDQLAAFRAWDTALDGASLMPSTYDGDTPSRDRSTVRKNARLLLTNPEMLHTGILPHHAAWRGLLADVSWIVVDEMHVYRGVFGSHVANVLRRLKRVCEFHGASPRFLLTSATIANPAEHARRLTGERAAVVEQDGAPRGRRTFIFYNPPIVDQQLGLRRSSILESDRIARHFLAGGVQTIVFSRSRQAAELLMRYIGEGMEKDESAPDGGMVRAYRGGYTPSERRAIEAALRDGELRGVVATSALELGIDIGDLDVCVLAGYPGTIASTWQRAGRAGRRLGDAAAVLVAGPGPLDQYIARHPETVLDRSPEHARIDPDNLLILLEHVRCATFELPFTADEAARPFGVRADDPEIDHTDDAADSESDDSIDEEASSGGAAAHETPNMNEILSVLEAQGDVRTAGGRWFWNSDAYPAATIGLRNEGGELVTIVRDAGRSEGSGDGETGRRGREMTSGGMGDASGGGSNSEDGNASAPGLIDPNEAPLGGDPDLPASPGRADVLGTVDRSRAATTVHPGAIYLHAGRAWQVTALDWDSGRATVIPSDGATYTRASSRVDVSPTRIGSEGQAKGVSKAHGELEIKERATGYREIRFKTHETVGWGRINLPERVHTAGGYWFMLDDETVASLRDIGQWQQERPGDRGPNWAAQRQLARERDGQRCRLCSAEERPDRQHDVHHIRPFHDFGWRRGENEAYLEANALENLITLCASCHRVAERALGLHGALSGLGYALSHLAPLVLMCDASDLGVTTESLAPWSGKPTVVVYERAAGGVGFGDVLFDRHAQLMDACLDLVSGCACASGCPACIGPVESPAADAKAHTLAVLRHLVEDG